MTMEGIDDAVVGREKDVRARTLLACLLCRMAKRGIVWTVHGEVGIVCCVADGWESWVKALRCVQKKPEA